jgi:hypothetical protein
MRYVVAWVACLFGADVPPGVTRVGEELNEMRRHGSILAIFRSGILPAFCRKDVVNVGFRENSHNSMELPNGTWADVSSWCCCRGTASDEKQGVRPLTAPSEVILKLINKLSSTSTSTSTSTRLELGPMVNAASVWISLCLRPPMCGGAVKGS